MNTIDTLRPFHQIRKLKVRMDMIRAPEKNHNELKSRTKEKSGGNGLSEQTLTATVAIGEMKRKEEEFLPE